MILTLLIITYIRDCKELGKENLAAPLSERLLWYFIFVILPLLVALIKCIK